MSMTAPSGDHTTFLINIVKLSIEKIQHGAGLQDTHYTFHLTQNIYVCPIGLANYRSMFG